MSRDEEDSGKMDNGERQRAQRFGMAEVRSSQPQPHGCTQVCGLLPVPS